MDFGSNIDIIKAKPDGSYVRGWAYVAADENGKVVDYSGDVLGGETVDEGMAEVRKMAEGYICDSRVAKVLHKGKVIGEIMESVIVDDAFAASTGMTTKRRGWWIGMAIHDEAVRKRVRSGELKQFSIGGKAKCSKIAEAA